MYFNTIEIRRSNLRKEWYYSGCELPYDRKNEQSKPDGILGFWHYPRKLGEAKAFEKLKQSMIESRLQIIKSLETEIEELNKLTYLERNP